MTPAILGVFHNDAVEEFKQEFPAWRDRVEALIRERKIVIVEQKGEPNVNKSTKP